MLKLEFGALNNIIREYTEDANVINYLERLDSSLQCDDLESVLYCIEGLCNWYSNLSEDQIYDQGDNYLGFIYFDYDGFRNKMQLLQEIQYNLEHGDYIKVDTSALNRNKTDNKINYTPKIFLSHCSANKKFGNALQKLITGLGIENDQLIYSSHPLHKIPVGENIYEYLRMNINQEVFVIILWSNEYLESPACLNEMGAAWVTQTDYINLYTPDFAFGNPKYHQCAVDTRKMGAVLNGDDNCKASMIEFKNKIIEMFDLTVDEQKNSYLLDQFMKDIR
jgi:hypothetical protein